MRTSHNGLAFITRWEGCVLHVYLDCVGIPTVGVGHVVLVGEDFSEGISQAEAEDLLSKDVAKVERAIERYLIPPVLADLTQPEFDALVSFGFNCGVGAIQTSSATKRLNAGDVTGAADSLLLWCKAGGKPNHGLLNRRKAERALFLSQSLPVGYENVLPQAHGVIEPLTEEEARQVLTQVRVGLDLSLDFTPHRH